MSTEVQASTIVPRLVGIDCQLPPEPRRPVKLIVQIPCFNEEATLPATLADVPRAIPGIDIIELLVISDGSTDDTVKVARECGVDHVVDLPINKGLATAFMAGIDRALREGADIIVNTDADNQYRAADIARLVQPILEREAEFVVGDRPIPEIAHFSKHKRMLQHLGSFVVRVASGTKVGDAPSGFRALSREAAMRINTFDSYTYTLETIVYAGLADVRIVSVPIGVNGETRPSRLVRSIPDYVARSARSILRTRMVYQPAQSLILLSLPLALMGLALLARWLWLYVDGTPRAHVPSLLASAGLLTSCVFLWIAALIGKLLAINRRLLQDIQYRLRRYEAGQMPDDAR